MRVPAAVLGMIFFLMSPATIPAQGLFESAGNESSTSASGDTEANVLAISGYVKGALFGGQDNAENAIVSGSYAQSALKLDAEKTGMGRAFAELRLNAGYARGTAFTAMDVREAWVSVSPGLFDIRLGRQILPWGRADAINPTNSITPRDQTALSSEFDDTRMGNELLQIKAKIGPSRIQGIWIPCYRPDVLPLEGAEIPPAITIADPVYPDRRFTNGGYAVRIDVIGPSIDGSVSYYNGYATLPGFDGSLGQAGMSLIPRAYRMHAAGADFSAAVGPIGLRGEAAIKYPFDGYDRTMHVPNPYAQYVLGLDKSVGKASFLIQYSGLYVIDYRALPEPVLTDPLDPAAQQRYAFERASAGIKKINRLFTGTVDGISHALTGNVHWNTLYETLHLTMGGMYDVTTKDYAINPSASYDIADAVSLAVGGRYLDGPEGNLNHIISNLMSFVYTELRMSF
ncbi:MAG: hypothetical protein JXA71_14075 [Chitinispirillaceae bacterium]|nr:hypothetical protein [Chitinispirillaceae bacterium]